MSKDNEKLKLVSTYISKESWKKLKILSVQKDLSFSQCVREVLEKCVSNKKMEIINEGEI